MTYDNNRSMKIELFENIPEKSMHLFFKTFSYISLSFLPFLSILSFTPEQVIAEAENVIDEVVVTAERRLSTVQDTPIALTAYSSDEIQLRGIGNIEDLQFSSPNLVISHNSQSPVTYAYIRGIGSDQLVAGNDPGTAYNVDGIYVGQPSSMPGDLWDLQRIEVLRGPQGTLYGRNTTGGSINIITNEPTSDYEAFGDITVGNYGRKQVRGVVNGGSETASARISFITDKNDGFQENLVGKNGDQIDHESIRGKLKFNFNDSGEILLTAQRFSNNGRQSQKKREPFGPVELAPGFVINVYEGADQNNPDPRIASKDYPEMMDLENQLISSRIRYDMEDFSLISITGKIENEWQQNTDIDMSENPVQFQTWHMDTDQFTQEIQLVSNGEGSLDWIVGLFHFKENLDTDYTFLDSSIAGFAFFNGGDLETKSQAVFGQITYSIQDTERPVRITAGLRHTKDEKNIDEYQQIPAFGMDLSGKMKRNWNEMGGKLGLDFYLSEDVMGFASYSQGYKGGGFSIGQFDAFDPEKVNSLEFGLKSEFWDNRGQVNLALFTNDYKDLQVNFLEFTSFTTDNAAEASINGLELESRFITNQGMDISANFTWLDATFDTYQFTPEISLDGQTINRAPEFTLGFSAQKEWDLKGSGKILARFDYYWQDEVYYRVQNIERHREDSFSTMDFRAVWTSLDEKYTVDAFIKNLTDEDNLRGLTVSDGLSTGNNSFLSYYPPRTIGLRVGFNLGSK